MAPKAVVQIIFIRCSALLSNTKNLILYAPNIHVGGGITLLRSLIKSWPTNTPLKVFLDVRTQYDFILSDNIRVYWVDATLKSRMAAEIQLSKVSTNTDLVLCFNGLPPLYRNSAEVVVFLQNKIYLDARLAKGYPFKTTLRLAVERLWLRLFRARVETFVVQTPAMKRSLLSWYDRARGESTPNVEILPFVEPLPTKQNDIAEAKQWDFVYVADGVAHKNHRLLFDAWILLAEEGLYPSLALTLSSRDAGLKSEIEALKLRYNCNIVDLGELSREKMAHLYESARALIYPSKLESFGLPLIEATSAGLPILASELDYVRDVCEPVETFSPDSAVSISRAVKRFLKIDSPLLHIRSPIQFWKDLFELQ